MENQFTLITGRTIDQAKSLHKSVSSSARSEATCYVQLCKNDMSRLNLEDGQVVRLCSETGRVDAPVRPGDLPSGLIFIPMGPTANKLVGTETFGTGMPAFKGEQVKVEKI